LASGVRLSGFLAWWAYRSVYLFKMRGFARKLRVALDWTFGMLFPREVVQLGVHRYAPAEHADRRDQSSEAGHRTD
jgi:hypothetical protein